MSWSITIGRIAGTAIRIHFTFLIFLFAIAFLDYAAGGVDAAKASIVFLVLLFACVLAHEFGHILMARRFGVATPDVTLLPIGGVASMERIPDDPRQELLIAIAGPMVNVVIAVVLMAIGHISPGNILPADFEKASLLHRLAFTNVALVVFNIIPAFPMDGGRVLRALLAMSVGLPRATAIASRLGQVFAFLFVLAGLFYNPFLIFIGMFIYVAAVSEQQQSAFRWFAHGLTVQQAMEGEPHTLAVDATLADAVEALLATPQQDFPVVDGAGRAMGLLTREDLLQAFRDRGGGADVSSVMKPQATTRGSAPLETVVADMNRLGLKSMVVVDQEGRAIALLTRDNIMEMMMVHSLRPEWRFASHR
jgi:Zn-dependent protease/CBS domain-containing protein